MDDEAALKTPRRQPMTAQATAFRSPHLQSRPSKLPRYRLEETNEGWLVMEVMYVFDTEQEAERKVRELNESTKGEQR